MNIGEFLDWVKSINNFLKYMEIPEEKQVKIMAYKLKGLLVPGGIECKPLEEDMVIYQLIHGLG